MNIYAVVVTYNRLNLLKEVVNGLKDQTFQVSTIIVVNNGSSDGTLEWLSNQENLVVVNQENLGGAGGFCTGMRLAFERDAEWIWVMDDDVVPYPDTLEAMLKYSTFSGCIVPTRRFNDGTECRWGYIYDIRKRRVVSGTRTREQDPDKPFNVINTCCFEGALISRDVVSKIGFPDKRFFISGDDTVYGLLASRYTNIINVKDAVMRRCKSSSDARKITPFYAYYKFRNFHLFEEFYCKMSGRRKYEFSVKVKHYLSAGYFIINAFFHNRTKIVSITRAVLRGLWACHRRRVGNTF